MMPEYCKETLLNSGYMFPWVAQKVGSIKFVIQGSLIGIR